MAKGEDLFNNKTKAFRYMLSEDTLVLNSMREELSFYTN